ncbi:MAG: site-specific integrase [Oscillospiraceae bacterium]|nr:site-specific integrase [Oscillospiraceae bacterium]
MSSEELAKEVILDCKVRNLSPRTVRNYEKQLAYFARFLKETEDVEELEKLKPIHIKEFIAILQEKNNKPS